MTYHERDNEKDKKKIKSSSSKTTTPNTAKETSSSKASATGSSFTVGKVPKLGYTNYNGNVGDSYPVGGVSPVTGTTTKARYTQQGLKQTWHGKSYKDLTYAEYTAMARKTNAPQEVFDRLEYETTLPGSQFYNPYKSGTQHQEIKDFFAENYGYTGEFDDDFVTNYRHFLNGVTDDMRSTTTGSLTSPGKKGTTEQWAAYYYNQIARYNKESNETNAQWSDMRNAYANFYREFETVYQRKPTMEEFVNAVDINDYSKLKAIEDSYTGEKSLQVLNVGTNYSRDAITGLYYALQNGEDISVDRDYVEDAVEYYMNPVQQAPSVKGKYGWSNSDLSAISNEDAQGYLRGLAREGKMEEYAAFNEALWQSRPHDDSVDTTNILGETYGYYQNDEWFDAVGAALGDEYTMRLQRDGSMKKPGSNASIMDQACYEYYQAEQKREFTDEVEAAAEWVKSAIQATGTDLYAAEDYELYHDELMNYICESDAYKAIEKYIEDPTKSCRPVFVSEDGIGAMIARHWKGLSIDENYDYSASAPYGYSDMFTTEKASEPPVYYDQQQEENAVNDLYERRSNKQIFSSVVQQLSESGANISLTDFEVEAIIPQTYSSVEGMPGIVEALWYSVIKPRLDARLGADASYDQILASDPVLKGLNAVSGVTAVPALTLENIAQVARLTVQSDISNDDPSLAMGVVENTLPGINGILKTVNGMYDKYGLAKTQDLFNGVFDAAAYRSAYADAKARGLSEDEAASSAIFKATTLVSAVESIGNKYEGDADVTAAASELINGVRLEEGTNEVVDILEIVNDEVLASSKLSLDVDSDGAPDMSSFNAAIMIGSTSYADPGFSAFTKDIVHDIATGDIKAEHVAEGVKAYNNSLKLASPLQMAEANLAQNTPEEYIAAQKAAQTPESRMVRSAEGVVMSAQDYTAAKEEARNYMSGFVSPEEMSDNLKKAIGYDHLMAYLDEVEANDIPVDRMAVLDATIASFHSENKTRHRTSELMHGATDIDTAIAEYASQKTDADRQTNITATERNYLQAMIEDDRTNFLPRIAAVAGYLSSDTGHFVDAFDNNGMFFSNEEVAAIAKSYFNGDVTLEEVYAIIDDRKENYDVAYVNALNNPAAVQDSYAVIDAGMENLTAGFEANEADATSDVIAYLRNGGTIHDAIREYPESMAGIAENLDTYTAQAEDEYGGTDQTALMNLVISELEGNGGANATTEEQMSMAQKAVDFYKSLGPAGYLASYMTNEQVKSFSNGEVDLSSVGIASLKSILDRATDGAWAKPYGNYEELNLAYTVFGGVSKGIGKVIVAPANMLEVIRHGMDAVTGDWYTENVASLPGAARLAMRQSEANADIDSSEAEYAANVLTNTDIFLREGISEFVRNLMISGIGRGFAGVVEKGMPVSDLTYTHMVDDAIAGIADIDKAIKMSTTIARRLPFAANVFANDTLQNYKKSKSFSKSFIKGVLSAGIELGTESMGLEKMLSFNVRGMKLTARAMSAVNSNSAMMLGWMSNTAKNIVTEIGQEEAAMFLGRVVDFGDAAITQNKSVGEAFNESFAGMGEEAKATALSTAFTTLMFGAVDLGGMTYQNSRRHMENGTEYSSEQLLRDMLTDIALSMDEDVDVEEAVENEPEPESKPVSEAESAVEAEPVADAEAMKEEVAQEDSEESVSKSEDEVAEAVKNQILNPSEENVEAVVAAVEALETSPAVAEEAAPAEESPDTEEVETPAEEPVSEAPVASEEVVSQTPDISPEAQKVYNYLEQSDAGIDKSIVKAGSQKAAEQAVENDPGVKASRKNIEAKKAEIAETEGKIAQIAHGIQQKKNQQTQAFAAAVDQGIDPTGNNPLVLNPKMSLGQAIDGMAGEQAKLEEDLGKKQTEVQRHQQELDERTREILAQAEAESSEKLSAQMQQFREERLREADQYANAYRDKDGELQPQSLMTGDEYIKYKGKAKAFNEAGRQFYESGYFNLDEYTDPGAYPASPIRDSDWRDEQKRTDDEEEEYRKKEQAQIRLTQEFFANEDSRGFMLEQPKDVYDTVVENMRKELGYVNTDLVSERGSYKSEVEATMSPLETGDDGELVAKESAYEVNSDGEVVFKDPAIKSVLAGTDDIDDNKTDVGHDKYVHVTENDQYLVIKKRNDSAFEAGKKVKDAEASNAQKEAEIALQRWDEARDMYDRALADYDKAVEADVAASERFAATSDLPLRSKEAKSAALAKKNAADSLELAKRRLDTARSRVAYAQKQAEEVSAKMSAPKKKNTATRYIVIDKSKLSETSLEIINAETVTEVVELTKAHENDTVEQLADLCTDIQVGKVDGEYQQSFKELVRQRYSEMSRDDLKIEYYKLVQDNIRNTKIKAALNSAFQYVDSKKGLDAFIAENGGEAEGMDQSQGKGFQTFTKRREAQTKYLVSEYALRKYGDKKNAGGTSDEQYDLALAKKFNDFARKAGASADDAEAALGRIVINPFEDKSGESTFKKVTRGPKFSLMVRNQDRNNPDVNSWIRDNDALSETAGEYSEQMAWDRIAKKMSDIVWGVKEHGKINVKTRNVIDIKYIDENGEARVKRFGEYYGKSKDAKDAGNYWFPSVEWVKENAIEVTCNFFCKNPGDKKTTSKEAYDYAQASRLNIKLVPNPIADNVDREYNPQDNFAEDAYMRTRWELAEDYKRAAKDFNENPNSSFFARAFYEAEHNGLVNTMNRIAGQYNAGGVTADKRAFLEGEFVRCRTKLELVTEELRKLEKTPFKEVPANTSARENAPASSDKLSQLRERLALLTSGNPQYDLPFYETEKKAFESLISYYSNQTEAEAPVAEQNTEEQAATPIYTDDQIAAVTERVNSTVYDSEESFYNDLVELKDMADAVADVSALRSGVIKQYHDLKMKGMNQSEKMEYLYALAESAKKNPDSYTIDPNTDYESMLGTSIEDAVYGVDSTADQRKLKGQLYNIKRRAGTYKSAKAIDSALKRLDGLEKAGLDVSDVRSALEENRKAFEPSSEVAKKPPITSFRGDHSFLSNFHDAPVTYEGVVYRNAEAAFQAAKSTDPKVREGFTQLSGKDAKRKGRTIQLRSDWNDACLGVMEEIVRNKFKQNPELAKKLIDTNGSDLVEGNTWRDTFWGVDADTGVGENNLGKVLMKVRDELVSDTRNPNQERIDEALEAVEDEETKVDLQFFAEDTPDSTLDSVYDKMPDDLKEFSWRDDGVNTGFNDMAAAIEDANDLIRDRSAFEYTVSEIGRIQSEIKAHTDDINRVASDINKLKSRAAEIRSRMKDIEAEAEEGWRHEHVQEYNDLHAELMSLDTQKAKMQAEKDGIVEQRNSAKATQQKLSMAVLASDVANDILNNRATFSPKNLKTANVKAEFSDGRASGREMLSKVTAARMKNRVDGRLTTYTPQQLAEYYGEAIDEKAMAFDNEVATVLNRQVKEMKKAKILLELESTWLTNKNVRDGDKKITRARAEAIEAILALTPPKGYTEADYRKQMSNRDKAIKTVAEFITNLENSYTDQAAIDLEYRVVGEQLAAINGAIERGEKAVSDYFNISSKGLNGVMDGTNGGHTPHAVMQIDLAMILDGAKKSSNPKHVVARNVDEPVRVIDKYLGENADIFNSRYMAPVIEANGKIADRKSEIREQMKALKLSKDEGIAVFHALDQGMNENDIRTQYPEIADKVMAATPVVRQILDELIDQMNVTLVRNGLDPVKRRNNYVPYIRKEESDLLRAIGVNTSYDELPTALLGNTEGTTPAHQFNQHMLEREGADVSKCIQDINEVIERYAASTLPVIYQTDNIIRFDDLIEAVNENVEYGDDLTYDKGKLSVFRTFLSDYRDSLAGKKVGKVDRAIEANVGRKYFGVVKAATKAKGLSATMGNNSVVAANVIPLVTFFAIDPVNTLKATYQTILHQGFRIDDGVMRNASFNKARSQGYREAKSTFDKVTNAGYKLPSVVDELVAEIGYRSHYNSSLARNGAGGADQAAMNASNFVYRVMSDKNTGMKPMLYSTSWGSMALQFTQEAVNNISFIVNDLAAYEGYRKGDLLSMATGSAKALAALIAMFFGGYWINRGTGRNVALDPYGAYEDARKSAGDDASVVDIAKSTVSNFVDTANPMSSVTEGGLLGAPVISGVIDVLEPIWNMVYNGEVDQWKELAKGIFNWAPASVAMKRLWDTYQAVDTGYTTTAAGRIKYPFEGTAENIVRSSLFGPNSTEAGQEYVSSGYRSLSESQTRQMDAMTKQGIAPSDAYRTVVKSSEASSEASKAKAGQKIGVDVSEHTDAAKAARSEMEIPVEMADVPAEHMQRDSVKKGIEIWRETGEAVYFKPSISFSKNTYGSEDRVGVERGGVFYEATPEEQERMNQRYFREYDRILNAYDLETGSVAELKKALSNAESRIRADFAKSKGGE